MGERRGPRRSAAAAAASLLGFLHLLLELGLLPPLRLLADAQEHLLDGRLRDVVVHQTQRTVVRLQLREDVRQTHGRRQLVRQPPRARLQQLRRRERPREELLQARHVLRAVRHAHRHLEPGAKLPLQVRLVADAVQHAVHHDRHAVRQRLHLLQVVRRQHHRAVVRHRLDRRPQAAPRDGVHARRRLVQEHDARTADQRDGHGQLAPIAAAQRLRLGLAVVPQLAQLHQALHHLVARPRRDPAHARVQVQVLLHRQQVQARVELRAVADALQRVLALPHNVVAADRRVAARREELLAQNRNRRRLPRTVRPQEAEHLAGLHAERDVAHRHLAVRELLPQRLHAHQVVLAVGVMQHRVALRDDVRVLVHKRLRLRVRVVEQPLAPLAALRVVHEEREKKEHGRLHRHVHARPPDHVHVEGGSRVSVRVQQLQHGEVVDALTHAVAGHDAEDPAQHLRHLLRAILHLQRAYRKHQQEAHDEVGKHDRVLRTRVVAEEKAHGVRHANTGYAVQHEQNDRGAQVLPPNVLLALENAKHGNHKEHRDEVAGKVEDQVRRPVHVEAQPRDVLQVPRLAFALLHDPAGVR
ncbi:ATP-binding protein cassette protein subfamily A, member 8 [Strigomonas culicis]|uniref:ATP-binding protein cassette protein subfamily A, member 8 n=1 Tax=Strigomonas culicis TaxID=28005 RepID=S9WLX5_9TRYP|nr:ATP-binding protein cassette protein subfamily A, member 8 [Strigomonas culicis]|eukprot:EPY37000.1 ATP-binding protein cassette protein subfamily A, member 8 [Strigomonas culicis]